MRGQLRRADAWIRRVARAETKVKSAAMEREKTRFFEVIDRLARSRDADEQERLKDELARMTFGG
jgi:hypothetical protein